MILKSINNNLELKNAIKIVWYLTGLFSFIIILIVIIIPSKSIFESIPTCRSIQFGTECFLCGTTRAFYKIKELEIMKAYELNKLSPFLFLAMLINIVIIIFNIKHNYKKYENS